MYAMISGVVWCFNVLMFGVLQNSCAPQVLNDIRTAKVHNRPS